MAPLPPPPPPAPPPPPPMAGLATAAPKNSKNEAMDRNALLSQIRGGARLKKAPVVNDRSSPQIDGKSATSSGSSSAKTSAVSSGSKTLSNGPPLQLGGLFSGGVPKLKPTGKLNTNGDSSSVNKINVNFSSNEKVGEHRSQNTASTIKTSLEEKLNFNSQNNASYLHTKTSPSSESNRLITNKNKYHTINVSKPRERSVISSEGKGQAPQVPTASSNTCAAPSLPKKPVKLQRSNSQSNSQNNKAVRAPRAGPPNIKPPPPPKFPINTAVSQSSNSKNNVNRRQSIGDSDKYQDECWNGKTDISSLVNNFNIQGFKPPAPLRNDFSQSPTYPPPPPPLSTLPNRVDSSSVTSLTQTYKQMAPPLPSQLQASRVQPNIRPPIGPPPPPPHRTTSTANSSILYPSNGAAPPPPSTAAPAPPQSQTKVIPPSLRNGVPTAAAHALAPLPPVRNTSISREEFAARFATFKAICELPAPQPISNFSKQYPSHLQQSQRRRDPPPPPPPQFNGTMAHTSPHLNAHNSNNAKKFTSTPMLHIQFGSSVAQC